MFFVFMSIFDSISCEFVPLFRLKNESFLFHFFSGNECNGTTCNLSISRMVLCSYHMRWIVFFINCNKLYLYHQRFLQSISIHLIDCIHFGATISSTSSTPPYTDIAIKTYKILIELIGTQSIIFLVHCVRRKRE